jgi:hypothetical protein
MPGISLPAMVGWLRGDLAWKVLSSNKFHIYLSLLASFTPFIPLLTMSHSNVEGAGSLVTTMGSEYFRGSSAAAISLAAPIMFDALIDWLENLNHAGGRKINAAIESKTKVLGGDDGKSSLLNFSEKLIFIYGVVIVPILAFLPEGTPNLGILYVCCSKSQIAAVGCIFMTSMCRLERKYFPVLSTLLMIVIMIIALPLETYAENGVAGSAEDSEQLNNYYQVLINVGFYFTYLSGVIVLFCCIRLTVNAVRVRFGPDYQRSNLSEETRNNRDRIYLSVCYCFACIICLVIFSVVAGTTSYVYDLHPAQILGLNVAFISFELSVLLLQMRIVKLEVLRGLVSCCTYV